MLLYVIRSYFCREPNMNRTKIEWCDYTWNPVVGCKRNCVYCYAKKMNHRFKWIDDWNKPKFFLERLEEPCHLNKPSTIFVGSMCDLWEDNIPNSWKNIIIKVAKDCQKHVFMFLTKNPDGYAGFEFSTNCKIGLTMEKPNKLNYYKFVESNPANKFLSIEPILANFQGAEINEHEIGLVIIGAMTGKNPIIPRKEWIKSIKHKNIFYKNNVKGLIE